MYLLLVLDAADYFVEGPSGDLGERFQAFLVD